MVLTIQRVIFIKNLPAKSASSLQYIIFENVQPQLI